jgi:hypothetical protein
MRFATMRQRKVFPFIAQSAFFVFSSPSQILRSFSRHEKRTLSNERKYFTLTHSCKTPIRLFKAASTLDI